ncbi:MAG TPA: hypothetical protein ENJ20_06805 [Bacteroidetes bacterium]|nr:hypothetical protein [Bacteroidota bacterium]
MSNYSHPYNENFLKVHPDLAALFREIEEIEASLEQLKKRKKALKKDLKSARTELDKRLASLKAWQMKGQKASKKREQRRSQVQ